MATDFEQLLCSAVPEVPDPGDVRRLNRRDLQRALVRQGRRRRCASHGSMIGVAMLLLMVVFVGDLGSDGFDVTSSREVGDGTQQLGIDRILRLGHRGQAAPQVEGWTENETREFALQNYNDEGKLLRIEGWESDKGSVWSMVFSANIGGRETQRSREPKGMEPKFSREFLDFIVNDLPSVKEALEEIPGSVGRDEVITIEGVPRVFRTWTFSYPGQGTVIYHRWSADR